MKLLVARAVDMGHFSHNLRRLMADLNLTILEVAARSGLDERTIKSILSGASSKPHARTLHQLAQGLGVHANEFFQSPLMLSRRTFDQQTNPEVDELVSERPELFVDWSNEDFDELYSHMGTGGALTSGGAAQVAAAINRKRELHEKLALLLETEQASIVAGILNLLYEQMKTVS